MFVQKENGVIVASWSSPQNDAQREQGEMHPDWLPDDHPNAVARHAFPVPAAPSSRPNWTADGILLSDED